MSELLPPEVLEREHTAGERDASRVALRALLARKPEPVLVVSDLHLGLGVEPGSDCYVRTENFFSDEGFGRLLDHTRARAPDGGTPLLILNGDIIDFVRNDVVPAHHAADTPDLRFWQDSLGAIGIRVDRETLQASIGAKERTYGLRTDPIKSLWKLALTVRGHRPFFEGLARWVHAGGSIVFQRGNHDLEQYWFTVRDGIRQAIAAAGADPARVDERVLFVEDGNFTLANLYVDHGHQYESMTEVIGDPVLDHPANELNYPMGSFVNRYLINPLEHVQPFLDNLKPVEDVVLAILKRYPVRALRIVAGSSRGILRGIKMRRVWDSLAFLGYILLVVLPFLTVAIIVLAVACKSVGDWFVRQFGQWRVVLGAVGFLFPYFVGAIKEFWATYGPKRHWGVAEEMYDRQAGRLAALPGDRIYLVAGHTHELDSRVVARTGAKEFYYLNTGTWVPLWPKDRPDLIGRTLHPVVMFHLDARGLYVHALHEWDDSRGDLAPLPILAKG